MTGITYSDIISLSFTLSTDPDDERPVGSGIETSSLVVSPTCYLIDINGDGPADGDADEKQCGQMIYIPFSTIAPGILLYYRIFSAGLWMK